MDLERTSVRSGLTRTNTFDGIAGYSHSGSDPEFFDAKASVNGGEMRTLTFQDRRATLDGVAPGDTVKLILEIDPAKTEFDQTPVEATDTVD